MALVTTNKVTTSGTGGSDHFLLANNGQDWTITVTWAGSAGDADLQFSPDQSAWGDVRDSSGVVNITANYAVRVPGGLSYRLDVNTHTSVATMLAIQ